MQGTIEQYGRKSINRGYVEILRRVAQWSRSFKQSTVGYAPGKRTWNALKWYEDELERVKEAILEAEKRKEESHSVLSSMKLGKSSADSHVAKIRAKMASAEIKAKTARNGRGTTNERVCKTAGDKTQDRTSR